MSSTTVNVSFSKELLRTMDAVAREEARTRSELLREAVRQYVERRRQIRKMFSFWQKQAKRLNLKPKDVESMISETRKRSKL